MMLLSTSELERRVGGHPALVAARCGISKRTLVRYRHSGLTPQRAEELAVAAGYFPSEIWGADYETAEDYWGPWPRPDSWRARVTACSDACRCEDVA